VNITNLIDADKIINEVKCDFTPKINFVNIDSTDPLRLGSNSITEVVKPYLSEYDFEYFNQDYWKTQIKNWVNGEMFVACLYAALRNHSAYNTPDIQSMLEEMQKEETTHARLVRSFYIHCFGEEPELKFTMDYHVSPEFAILIGITTEIFATSTLKTFLKLSDSSCFKNQIVKILLADDTKHEKYTETISLQVKSLENATDDEKRLLQGLIRQESSKGTADFEYGTWYTFQKHLDDKFDSAMSDILKCQQTKLFQDFYKKQVKKWLDRDNSLKLILTPGK